MPLLHIVQLLLLSAAGAPQSGDARSLEARMVDAARAGMAANVRHYLEQGVDPDARVVGEEDCTARTALVSAIEARRGEVVLVLLDGGADPEARGSDGRSPLIAAVEGSDEAIVRDLIEAGASVNTGLPGPYGLFLHPLSSIRNVEILHVLLEAGADPNVRFADSETPLIRAAYDGRIDVVRMLLEAGAAVDAVNLVGASSLMTAVERGRSDVVQMLIAAHSDVNTRTLAETPLMVAAEDGPHALVPILLRAGARVDEKGWMGQTALVRAARRGSLETIQCLVEYGADVHLRDDTNLSALDWAVFCERDDDVIDYLESIGAGKPQ